MEILRNRPLAGMCCLSALFAIAASQLSLVGVVLLSIAAGAIFFLFLFRLLRKGESRRRILAVLLSGGVFLILLSSALFFHVRLETYTALRGKEIRIEGTVLERAFYKPYATSFRVEVDAIDGEACSVDMELSCSYFSGLQSGDRLEAKVLVEEPEYAQYQLSDGVLFGATCESADDCIIYPNAAEDSFRVRFLRWNLICDQRLEQAVGGREGKLASALLLGNRSAVAGRDTLAFRRAGISHLLALSGLHVSILIGFLDWVLRKFRMPKVFRAVCVVVPALMYLVLTGASFSTQRAVFMVVIMTLGVCLRAEYDSFTSLCVVLYVLLLVTPYSVQDTGMWMSFIAAGSIVIFTPLMAELWNRFYMKHRKIPKLLFRVLRSVGSGLFVGTVANLGLLTLQAIKFREVSVFSIPATLILSVPTSLTLISAITVLIFPVLAPVCRLFSGGMLRIAQWFSETDGALIPLRSAFCIAATSLVALSMILLALLKVRRRRCFLIPAALAAVAVAGSYLGLCLSDDRVQTDYILSGGGDLLLFSSGRNAVLVDFTDGTATGVRRAATFAEEAECTELGDLILSHYHNRDSYFLATVASEIRVHRLHLPVPQNAWEEAVAERLTEEAELQGIEEVCFDTDGLCVSRMEIQTMTHFLFRGTRHPALLFSVKTGGETLTYVNGSLPDSPLAEEAGKLSEESDILIVGKTGFSTNSDTLLPIHVSAPPGRILLGDERIFRILPAGIYAESVAKDGSCRFWMQ